MADPMHVLSHTAGVPRAVVGAGHRAGCHAVTYGFILGEIVRRATGKPISQVLAEEVAGPLASDHRHRVYTPWPWRLSVTDPIQTVSLPTMLLVELDQTIQ